MSVSPFTGVSVNSGVGGSGVGGSSVSAPSSETDQVIAFTSGSNGNGYWFEMHIDGIKIEQVQRSQRSSSSYVAGSSISMPIEMTDENDSATTDFITDATCLDREYTDCVNGSVTSTTVSFFMRALNNDSDQNNADTWTAIWRKG
jgi:hypothetical protein